MDSNAVGQRIKDLRQDLGLSLQALGDKVGVGASTVRKWETGFIGNMRSDKIHKVSEALGVTPDYLMGWDYAQVTKANTIPANNGTVDQVKAPRAIRNGAKDEMSKEECELIRIYRALSAKRSIKLLNIAIDLEAEESVQ